MLSRKTFLMALVATMIGSVSVEALGGQNEAAAKKAAIYLANDIMDMKNQLEILEERIKRNKDLLNKLDEKAERYLQGLSIIEVNTWRGRLRNMPTMSDAAKTIRVARRGERFVCDGMDKSFWHCFDTNGVVYIHKSIAQKVDH